MKDNGKQSECVDGKIYDYFDSNLSLSCQTYVLLIEHEGTMATLAEVSHSVDMDQDEVKVHRKKEKKGKRTRLLSNHLVRTSFVNKGFIAKQKEHCCIRN